MGFAIDIVSDVICPWCFIGKRRLERAFNALGVRGRRQDFAVHWRPFQLNPEMPAEGMDRAAYVAAKFGSVEKARGNYARLEAIGSSEGISFAFDLIRRTPNTVDAHRLIRFSYGAGLQDAVVERLFLGYFSEGVDIGDRASLARLAGEAGLDDTAVAAYLDSDAGRAEVLAEDDTARRMGIGGVPCFLLDRSFALSGAQEPEVILEAFDRVAKHAAGADAVAH